jgi:hypothetical protein
MSGKSRAFFSFVIAVFFVAQPVFAAQSLQDAFASIAHDPSGKQTKFRQALQELLQTSREFVEGKKTYEEAINTLRNLDTTLYVPAKPADLTQDSKGNNLAHKLFEHGDIKDLDLKRLEEIFGMQIFKQKNKDGLSPFEAYPEKVKMLWAIKSLIRTDYEKWYLLSSISRSILEDLQKTLGSESKRDLFEQETPDALINALIQRKTDSSRTAVVQPKLSDYKPETPEASARPYSNPNIETLKEFINGANNRFEALEALEKLTILDAPQVLALRDSNRNNLAHKFLEHISYGGVSQITTLNDFGGIDLFNQTNKGGLTPIAAYPREFAGLLEPLVDYSTLVGSDYTTLRPYPDTHPERQAQLKLQKLLKPAAQRDVQGVVERFGDIARDNSDYHEKLNEFFHIVNGFIKAYGSQISIPLERIIDSTFYAWLAGEQEGKAYMLNYKVNGKESLYNYFSKHDIDGDVRNVLSRLLPLYFEQGTPSASEVDLQRLENTYWIEDLIKTPNGSKYLKAYKNSRVENLASIALRSNDNHLFQEVVNVIPELLRATSSEGISPLMLLALARPEQYYDYSSDHAYDSYYDYLVSKTPSLALEKDPYGNTMSALHSLSQSHDEMMVCDFFANIFKAQTLGAPLWERIIDHPYIRAFEHRLHGGTGFVMLYTALNQTKTPLHQSFFQQNLDRRDEVNQLWKALFIASDRQIPLPPDAIFISP